MRNNRFGVFAVLFCISAIMLFVFSGNSHTLEIQQRLLCHAMGIDFENGEYSVTIQAFKPSGAGSDTPVDITKSNIEIVSASGKTVSEALEKCEAIKGKSVFLGHLKLICFGRSVDFSDPQRLFEFCLKDKTVYLGVGVCLSDTTAKELMGLELTASALSTENYTSVIKKNAEKSRTVKCTLLDFFSQRSCTNSVVLPVLRANSKGEDDGSQKKGKPPLELTSTAVIKDGRVLDKRLLPEESAGLCLLRKGCEEADLVLDLGSGKSSVRASVRTRKQRITEENGRLVYTPKLTVVVHKIKDIVTTVEPEEVARKFTDELKRQFDKAFGEFVAGENADVFGICKQIRCEYPGTFLENEDDIGLLLRATDARLEVECLVE